MSEKNGMQILEIHGVTRDDMGVYTCTAANGSGKASMSAELSIPGMRAGARGPLPGVRALGEEAVPNTAVCMRVGH